LVLVKFFPLNAKKPAYFRPVSLHLLFLSLTTATAAAAWSAATSATTTPTPVVGARRSCRSSAVTRSGYGLSRGYCSSTIRAIEVRLVLLVNLLRLIFVEVFSTLDQDRALVRTRLTLIKLAARTRWACDRGCRLFRPATLFAAFNGCT
jgi:hypothetical protein